MSSSHVIHGKSVLEIISQMRYLQNDLNKEYDSLKGTYASMKKQVALERLQAEEELLYYKNQLKESVQLLDKSNVTCEELREELKIMKLEREAMVAERIEKLAMKDVELKKVKEEKESAVLEKLQAGEELLYCKNQMKEFTQQLDRLNVTCEESREELKIMKFEREAMVAEMIEKLAKKDEELNKVKEEKEAMLREMAELLAKKDDELNQSQTMHNKRVSRIFPSPDSSRNALGAKNPNSPLQGEHPNVVTVVAAQSSSHGAQHGETYGMSQGKTSLAAAATPSMPVDNRPLRPLDIIDISDSEDEDPIAKGISALRAKLENSARNMAPLVKRGISDSDDRTFSPAKQHAGNAAEVQDAHQSKKGDFMETEHAKIQSKRSREDQTR